jgi:hypothetical protein
VLDPTSGIDVLEEQIAAIRKAVPGIALGNGKQMFVTAIESNSVTFNVHFLASRFEAERTASEFLKAAKTQFDHLGVAIRSLATLAK